MADPPVGHSVPEEPNAGPSLVRSGSDADLLRARSEGSARFSRNILLTLGAVTAGAGIVDGIVSRSDLGWAIGTFGVVLIALSGVQAALYRRDQKNRVAAVHLWDEGVELLLSNGEVRGGMWVDPDFGLQLVSRPAPPPAGREYLMIWLPDSHIPPVEITEDAYDRLGRTAADKGLHVSVARRGPREGGTQMIHIRNHPAPAVKAKSKSARKSVESERE